MPGDGTDGGDNVEQISSTGTGTQILKVKSVTSIDGASSEPYSIAAAQAPELLPPRTLRSLSSVTPADHR